MLRREQYALLFSALVDRGMNLINDPNAYRRCHYLPEWYALLEDVTPGQCGSPPDRRFPLSMSWTF